MYRHKLLCIQKFLPYLNFYNKKSLIAFSWIIISDRTNFNYQLEAYLAQTLKTEQPRSLEVSQQTVSRNTRRGSMWMIRGSENNRMHADNGQHSRLFANVSDLSDFICFWSRFQDLIVLPSWINYYPYERMIGCLWRLATLCAKIEPRYTTPKFSTSLDITPKVLLSLTWRYIEVLLCLRCDWISHHGVFSLTSVIRQLSESIFVTELFKVKCSFFVDCAFDSRWKMAQDHILD